MYMRYVMRAFCVALLVAGFCGCPADKIVPYGVGMFTGEQLREKFLTAGLRSATVPEYSDTVMEGVVIRQEPAAGTMAPDYSVVLLTYSAGPAPVMVPELTWDYEYEERLAECGLTVGTITYRKTNVSGWLEVQYPAPGARVPKGTAVDVVITRCDPERETIEIDSIEELQLIGNDPAYPLEGWYELTADLDASGTASWDGGAGFAPIGSSEHPFEGTLKGVGHTITGLTINRTDEGYAGLFAVIGKTGYVAAINLTDCVVRGGACVGAIAGATDGEILECEVSGAIVGKAAFCVAGGVAGANNGSIHGCVCHAAVTGESAHEEPSDEAFGAGGIAGLNTGRIRDCRTTGDIWGASPAGGIAGECRGGGIANCSATGDVTAWYSGGGLVGWFGTGGTEESPVLGSVRNCSATGDVTAEGYVGGLIGAGDRLLVDSCYATGSAKGDDFGVGGLIGNFSGTITKSSARGGARGERCVGGLVGSAYEATIEGCSAHGVAMGSSETGGFAGGCMNTLIQNSYSTGPVAGETFVGGFIGMYSSAAVTNCYSTGFMQSPSSWSGFCGTGIGVFSGCFFDARMSGRLMDWEADTIFPGDVVSVNRFREAGWFDSYYSWRQQHDKTVPFLVDCAGPAASSYGVAVAAVEGGSIEIQGDANTPWAPVKLTPKAAKGYRFAGWLGGPFFDDVAAFPEALWLVVHGDIQLTPVFLKDETIVIDSVEELQKIGRDAAYPCNWDYALSGDINAYGTAAWNDGRGFEPLCGAWAPFSGTLDGNAHWILGLHIDWPDSDYVGLFRMIGSKGRLESVNLANHSIIGDFYVGAVAGYCREGAIDNCHVVGAVSGSEHAGGLIGGSRGRIHHCYAKGTVQGDYACGGLVGALDSGSADITRCYSSCAVTGRWAVGGLVGTSVDYGVFGSGGRIEQCYALGDVFGESSVGGLVGENAGLVRECYSAGAVQGEGGGLIGDDYIDAQVVRSYWDVETSGKESSWGGDGRTTAQMMSKKTYRGWSFQLTWEIEEGKTYPWLR